MSNKPNVKSEGSSKGAKTKRIPASSSRYYNNLDEKTKDAEGLRSIIKNRTAEEIRNEIQEKNEKIPNQAKNAERIGRVLYLNLKDTLDNSMVGNNYLFELIKDYIKDNKSYNGLYKIDVIKKDIDGIICKITGVKNFQKTIKIDNKTIMEKKKIIRKKLEKDDKKAIENKQNTEVKGEEKDKETIKNEQTIEVKGEEKDKETIGNEQTTEVKGEKKKKEITEDELEDLFTVSKTYFTPDGQKRQKQRQGRKEDFLHEIEYKDSVIIDIQDKEISTKNSEGIVVNEQVKEIRKINPDDIIEEIGKYIKKNDNNYIKSKKIQAAMNFFNESKDRLAGQYIKDFFKLIKNENKEENKTIGKGKENYGEYKTRAIEKLKEYFENNNIHVHKENDIDKSAATFLLKKFGINPEKVFNEIAHNDVEAIEEGAFIDVGGTVNGIKVIQKPTGTQDEEGKEIKKTKIIFSEHSDLSDEAMLTNRPSSTTQILFNIFKESGEINNEDLPQIQRFVNFVNIVDSMEYQISSVDYPNNYQTILGLYRNLDIKDIFEYFKDPEHTGFERLPNRYMYKTQAIRKNLRGEEEKQQLKMLSEDHKKRIDNNLNNFKKLQKAGKELKYKNTKFIVDIEEKKEDQLQDGPQTAGYNGYGFFKIYKKRGNIYIYSPKKLPPMIEGFSTDGHFLIINTPKISDIENLLEIFSTENKKFKDDIVNFLKSTQKNTLTEEDITLRCNKTLPELAKKNIKVGKTYTGIINNVSGKRIYITLDKMETIKGTIKVDNKNDLKEYKKGDWIDVKITEIPEEEGKLLTLSLETKE